MTLSGQSCFIYCSDVTEEAGSDHAPGCDESANSTEQDVARARAAFQLLSSWHEVPGTRPDESIDPEVLGVRVQEAREGCRDNHRIAVGSP